MHPSLQLWIACNIRAVAALNKLDGHAIGAEFRVSCSHVHIWKPRALVETDLLINKAVEKRRDKVKTIIQVAQRKNKSVRREGPCAFGCPTTTCVDISGVRKWQRPPYGMKHLLNEDDVVCQRCYTMLSKGTLPKKSKSYNATGRPPE